MRKSLLLATWLIGSLSPCSGQASHSHFRLYWTDRGINSYNDLTSVTGNQPLVIRMPGDKDLPQSDSDWNTWAAQKVPEISNFVSQQQAGGATSAEILTAMNMQTGGYLLDSARLAQVETFMGAVGRAINQVKSNTQGLEVDGAFGSDGGQAITDISLGLSGENSNPLDNLVQINSRGSVEHTIDSCDVLPACTVVVSKADLPSSEMGMGDQFRRVANRAYAQEVYDDTGGEVNVIEADPNGWYLPLYFGSHVDLSSHVKLENQVAQEQTFKYRQYLGDGKWSDWQTTTGPDLLKQLLSNTNTSKQNHFDKLLKDAQSKSAKQDEEIRKLQRQIDNANKQLDAFNNNVVGGQSSLPLSIPVGWIPCVCPAAHPNAGILVGNTRWHTPLLHCPQ